MARRHLPRITVDRSWRRDIVVNQVFSQALTRERGIHQPHCARGAQFAGKPAHARSTTHVERFHPQGIPSKPQRRRVYPTPFVPQRERVNPVETRQELGAPLLPPMNQYLGIRPGAEPMTCALELDTEVTMVVDLAVEHDPERTLFVAHWLGAALRVNDTQPAVAQGTGPTEHQAQASVIGAAVCESLPETACNGLDVGGRIIREDTGNPAHLGVTHVHSTTERVAFGSAWFSGKWHSQDAKVTLPMMGGTLSCNA